MKILLTTSTFPSSKEDPVPDFVKQQVIEINNSFSDAIFIVHAPHNHLTKNAHSEYSNYTEYRYHYFWPRKFEKLTGSGIIPALKSNPFLYLEIPFLFFSHFVSLLKITQKERPDIIYAHWFTPQAINSAIVSKLTNTRFVFTTHASDVSILKKVPFSKHLVHWVCKNANSYSSVSNQTSSKLRQFFKEEEWDSTFSKKLSQIPMGASPAGKLNTKDTKKELSKFGLESNRFILFMGRLAEKKGASNLINSYHGLPLQIKNSYKLVIAGDGTLKKDLVKTTKALDLRDKVIFTGYTMGKTKTALINNCSMLCIPSVQTSSGDSEGLPVVGMESLLSGKITLVSDVSGFQDIINDGRNGFIFKNTSSENLTSKLLYVLTLSKSKRMAVMNSSLELGQKFSWKKLSAEYYKFLKNSLK